ncbi:MAG: TatD family hydrolase [Phycisphaerae bacterium]
MGAWRGGLVDTHCHLTCRPLSERCEAVIERARRASVGTIITVGTDPGEWQGCIELAARYEGVFCALGLHPHEARLAGGDFEQQLAAMLGQPKVVAIGETGLDYHYQLSRPTVQRRVFGQHLEVAERHGLPVVVHCRDAMEDCLAILREHPKVGEVVFHCFSGDAGQAGEILERGFAISLTGLVTFGNAGGVREAAKMIPLDRLMLETDAPYLSPEPVRKVQPNEPAHLVHIGRFVAELRQEDLQRLITATTANATDFFRLDSAAQRPLE